MNNRTIIITQARMGSSRLRGKVLKEVNGRPLLYYHLNQLNHCQYKDDIVVATTTEVQDNAIVDFCENLGTSYFKGSHTNVLERYYQAALAHEATTVVRVTSDCPIIDPTIVDRAIKLFLDKEEVEYCSNTLEPRTFPRGYDVEVFSFEALKKAHKLAYLSSDLEHVTPYIYNKKNNFNLLNMKNTEDLSFMRLTVDTSEDFQLMEKLLTSLAERGHSYFSLETVVSFLKENPELLDINKSVLQKSI